MAGIMTSLPEKRYLPVNLENEANEIFKLAQKKPRLQAHEEIENCTLARKENGTSEIITTPPEMSTNQNNCDDPNPFLELLAEMNDSKNATKPYVQYIKSLSTKYPGILMTSETGKQSSSNEDTRCLEQDVKSQAKPTNEKAITESLELDVKPRAKSANENGITESLELDVNPHAMPTNENGVTESLDLDVKLHAKSTNENGVTESLDLDVKLHAKSTNENGVTESLDLDVKLHAKSTNEESTTESLELAAKPRKLTNGKETDTNSVDIFGNCFTTKERNKITVACPHCQKKVRALGFIPHLSYCMGVGIRKRTRNSYKNFY
ncbi:hypothetical protein CDAR_449301 [Caerostris darwini]|uniref:SAGA-associated factor 11 n=1 Tax=Caerostris darwini TaxID=1538125 RepID=A0AAV4QUM0_9ARAC|nr:hypothetical protein CDAR_449301 [Caerostris darwini]